MLPSKYIDSNLQIVQADGDGGDSLNRIGCYGVCSQNYTLADEMLASNSAHLPPGRYCRNPKPGAWFSNPNNVTRDQMLPVEAYWAVSGNIAAARQHLKLRLKRALLHFSHENDGYDSGLPLVRKMPDVPSPVEICVILRAASIFKPLLHILDIALIIDVTIMRNLNERNKYDLDNQLLPCILACKEIYPTYLSKLAAKLYSKTDAASRLKDYHAEGPGKNGIKPLGDIMARAFEKRIVM